jgi:hypothetical protein
VADCIRLLERCALSGDMGGLADLAGKEQWLAMEQGAIDDGVAGWMYWHCMRSGFVLPERVERQWQHLYRHYAGSNLAALCRLEQVLGVFAERGIDALVLPGAPLLSLYPDLVYLSMDDVDLLVRADSMGAFADLLHHLGYVSPTRHPDIFASDELVLDVHIDLFHNERVAARRFTGSLPIEGIWERRSIKEVGGFELYCISAEGAAIYSAVHVLRHSFRRLNWFIDLHLLFAHEVDAMQLIQRSECASLQRPLLYELRFLQGSVELPPALAAWSREQRIYGVEGWFMRRAWADRQHNELGDVLWSFSIGSFARRLYFILQTLFPRPAVLMQVFPFLPAPLFPLAYLLRLVQLLLRGGRQLVSMVRKH